MGDRQAGSELSRSKKGRRRTRERPTTFTQRRSHEEEKGQRVKAFALSRDGVGR
jgi:hypothetical protein